MIISGERNLEKKKQKHQRRVNIIYTQSLRYDVLSILKVRSLGSEPMYMYDVLLSLHKIKRTIYLRCFKDVNNYMKAKTEEATIIVNNPRQWSHNKRETFAVARFDIQYT